MPSRDADRNLLFGISALQNNFIRQADLTLAMNTWSASRDRSVGEILVEQGSLDRTDHDTLEALITRCVASHDDNPGQVLAAMSSIGTVVGQLSRSIADRDCLDSLATIAPSGPIDPFETRCEILEPSAPPKPRELAANRVRYLKVREHARGGLGVVFVARDGELNREVALKEIKDHHADNDDCRAKFLLEAEVTGGLEHPGIVPVYGLGHHEDGRPFYAMKFIRGDSLMEAIAAFHADSALRSDPGRRNLALQKLLRRFNDVCNAIAYAHSRGVLHRDLKPHNVMVGKYGETLVVDWGLAKTLGRPGLDSHHEVHSEQVLQLSTESGASTQTLPGSPIGTPAYMSPEQAAGRLDMLGPATDIYGLGATLYHLIVGHPAITGSKVGELLEKVQVGDFPRPRAIVPWIDPALEAISLKAMSLNPADRYVSARALAEDVDRWIAGEPVNAYREPFRRRAGRWARKHRTSLAAAASTATVAILLLGSVAWFRTVERHRVDASALTSLEASRRLENESLPGDSTRWARAAKEAQRAVDHLEAGGSPALLILAKARLESLRAEEQMVAALEEARLQETKVKDGGFDSLAKVEAFERAFREYGIDLVKLSNQAAADRVHSSKIANELVAAIDDWSRSQTLKIARERLVQIAQAVDNDPILGPVREAIQRADLDALRLLCDSAEERRKLGPRLRYVFKSLHELDPSGSFPILEAIVRERPGDFWLNHDLGRAYGDAKPPRLAEAVRYFSVAVALRPDSPGAHINLGTILGQQGKHDEASAEYREAIRLKSDYANAHFNLATSLQAQGLVDEALAQYREVIRLNPNDADAVCQLGYALAGQGKIDEAAPVFRDAIRIRPNDSKAHYSLGIAHQSLGKVEESIAAYREAIRIEPGYAEAHTNLGNALKDQKKIVEAVSEYRAAILANPDLFEAHLSLAKTLTEQGKVEEAVSEWRQAVRLKPEEASPRANLANLLKAQNQPVEAIVEYREAIRLQPDLAAVHFNLGVILQDLGKRDEAIAEFQAVTQLDPNDAGAHYLLGNNLNNVGRTDAAIAEFRETIRLQSDHAEAHCNLGMLLKNQGRFREGLEQLEQGHALGQKRADWSYPSAEWVREARTLVEAEAKLPAILRGEAKPANAAERLILADVCQKSGRPAASARFAEEAFAESPAMADDLGRSYRYNAACMASLAASGAGQDEPKPDDASRARLRAKAVEWLRADLDALAKVLDGGNEPARKAFVAGTLDHWNADADLTALREPTEVDKLGEAERKEIRAFWADHARLLARARAAAP